MMAAARAALRGMDPGQVARFGAVGVAATLTHYGVAYLSALAVGFYVGNLAGLATAVWVSYLGHRLWTFRVTEGDHRRQFPRFLLISLSAFAASQGVLYAGLSLLALPKPLALAAAVATVPPISFLLTRGWVFR